MLMLPRTFLLKAPVAAEGVLVVGFLRLVVAKRCVVGQLLIW
jgi:hypothetical protein